MVAMGAVHIIKRILFSTPVLLLLLLLGACHTPKASKQQTITLVTTDTVIHERLVPISTPEDSARILALMQCDENGRVLLSWYEQQLSRNAELEFGLDSVGRLLAKFRTRPDTVYIEVADTTINQKEQKESKETVVVEVEKPLTNWQNYLQTCGMIANIFVIVLAGVWLLKRG